jgi:hypothetical protein
MAEAVGVSPDTVHRVWRENGLKADLVRKFKLSNDPRFVEKLADVVGLYMNPSTRWSSAWTRRARSRPSTAPSRGCR